MQTAAKELSVQSVTNEIAAFFSQPAVAQAVSKARADIIAPHGKGTIAISVFQQDLFAAAYKGAEGVHKAVESQRAQMRKLLLDQYGSTAPTFEQFRADRAALKILAMQKGLVDDQWVRKPYNAAIIELYKALPVSMSEAAIAKRAQRPTVDKAAAKAAIKDALTKAGAVKGDTTERDPSAAETVEQFIAKFGITNVLQAAARILAEKRESKLDATTLQAVAKKYAA